MTFNIKRLASVCAMSLALGVFSLPVDAQRKTDNLDRGIVAIKKQSGVFVSWRVQADEYYDVTYNVYRNGAKLNKTPLSTSNYTDASGSETASYSVAAVVNGVEQTQCEAVTPWNTGRVDKSSKVLFPCPAYYPIKMKSVTSRSGQDITANYTINDVVMADLDGDGKLEFIVKRINQADADGGFAVDSSTGFTVFEAYKWDGTRLWSIDVGPNMVSLNATETNIIAYDWDQDGKAEVLLRGADDMLLHKANGSTQLVGTAGVNTRDKLHYNGTQKFTNYGAEYLIYANGQTLEPYVVTDYPIARGQASDWGDTYGHRSSKYFMGAPYLDGRKPSIFLARGIYTKIEMRAFDVDPVSHKLSQRWSWSSGNSGPWFGQGNHNYDIADVDLDGCDEIIYGSMTIDNNGKGLSTTGLGHGDALHVGDLDPFRPGLEVFACNEDEPGNNFRNATTSEIYHRDEASGDDGRAMAGNFSDSYPGCLGASASSGIISLASDVAIAGLVNDWNGQTCNPLALNFRIYWDGDLLEETINGPGGKEGELYIDKWGARTMQTAGAKCINDTKKNPNFQGDIIGDWREELVMRSADDSELRIYSTTDETAYRMPCLWYDHQYRQGVTREALVYNQPPHVSYFVGAMEGLTVAPPVLTTAGRTEIANGNIITDATNGKQVLICEAGSYGIAQDGIQPSVLFVNAPSTVSGNNSNANISRSYQSIQLGASINGTDSKGVISGAARLVKQGEGLLSLTKKTHTYSGDTEVWGGEFNFCGTLSQSHVWLNRHTRLSGCGTYSAGVVMEYGATLAPDNGTSGSYGSVTISSLELHEGARVVIKASASQNDKLNLTDLSIRSREWEYGPKYLRPVFEISATSLPDGKYEIGTLANLKSGSLDDIIVECTATSSAIKLVQSEGKLYLKVGRQQIDSQEYRVLTALVDEATEALGTDSKTWGTSVSTYPVAVKNALQSALYAANVTLTIADENTDISAEVRDLYAALLAFNNVKQNAFVSGAHYKVSLAGYDLYLDLTNGTSNSVSLSATGTVVTLSDAGNGRWKISDANGYSLYYPNKSQNWLFGTSSTYAEAWTLVSDGNGAFLVNSSTIPGRCMGADYITSKVVGPVVGSYVDGRKDANNTTREDINGANTHWVFTLVDEPAAAPSSQAYKDLLLMAATAHVNLSARAWGTTLFHYPLAVKTALSDALAAADALLATATSATDFSQVNATILQALEAYDSATPLMPVAGAQYSMRLAGYDLFIDFTYGAANNVTVTTTGTLVMFVELSDGKWALSDVNGNCLSYPNVSKENWLLGTSASGAAWTFAPADNGACYVNSVAIKGRCLGADYKTTGVVSGTHVDGRKEAANRVREDINGTNTQWFFTLVNAPAPTSVSEALIATSGVLAVYDVSGVRVAKPTHGTYVFVYADGHSEIHIIK